MLKVDFLNVADGDAILICDDAADFVMLVDCGRPHVEFVPGSARAPALNHLMKARVDHIDLLVLTHLHFDHIGGAIPVLRHIPVKRLLAVYLPPDGAGWVFSPPSDKKSVVGLCDALNLLYDIVSDARGRGAKCCLAAEGSERLTNDLTMQVILPDDDLLKRQRATFDALYRGEHPDEDVLHAVSKERNCSSPLLRLNYAGRSVLLTGDAYASCWENLPEPRCDILKLPHHGDEKSMTEPLLARLKPTFAVISCENSPSATKERPSERILNLLKKNVPCVLCTENRALLQFPAATHASVRFEIGPGGSIRCLEPDA